MIREHGARIMGLDDPTVKMSKSVAERKPTHAIGITDTPDRIQAALRSAVTDADNVATFEEASPGVVNLLTIYQVLTGESRASIEERFHGHGYGALKNAVGEAVIETFRPFRERYLELVEDEDHVLKLLQDGCEKVAPIAGATLARAQEAMGCGTVSTGTSTVQRPPRLQDDGAR
jgi:tryptophanyl-tRNA synthetase